ncbi:MAG: PEP-CTERM sorting domain-containing protein [Mariniblastus sp.]
MKTTLFLIAVMFSVFANSVSADLYINEIRIDQVGSDTDEYFELFADGMTIDLSTYTYLVIGDGTGGSGVIENATGLTGTLNTDDFFLVAESSFTLSDASFVDQTSTLGFENGDNVTHMLVQDFTGATGDDLDTDDDGTFDVTPWSSIEDSIAILEEVGGGDLVYSTNTIGPNGTFVPAHVFRDVDGAAGAFQIGNFDPADGGDTAGFTNFSGVPEPGSLTVLGLMGLVVAGRRRR